jgi:hypothetical protein
VIAVDEAGQVGGLGVGCDGRCGGHVCGLLAGGGLVR